MVSMFLIGATMCLLSTIVLCEILRMSDPIESEGSRKHPGPSRRGTITRARDIATMAAWHREQMEGELSELCEYFGTHPDEDTFERAWCIDVVYHGVPVDVVLERARQLRRSEREAKKSKKG